MITAVIWLPAALFAGLFQAWRTAIQQRLRADLSVSGAGLVRYLYGAPVAVALVTGYISLRHTALPQFNATFVVFAAMGGVAQIIGTNLLIASFGFRNFVVGTAFSKTEAVQAAAFAWLVLSERVSVLVMVGIGVGVAGVLTLSLGGGKLSARQFVDALKRPVAIYGLGAGAFFALTAVLVKRATFALGQTNLIENALLTLAAVMLMQTVMHSAYIAWREPNTLQHVMTTWRVSAQVGVLAALGSACWFIGFATAPVALVRIVGQVEVLFTLAFARFYLHESTQRAEVIGLLLVAAGMILALMGSF